MKAIIYDNAGPPGARKLAEIEKPTAGNDEVLINVRAASVNPLDVGLLRHPFLRRIVSALSKLKNNRPGRDVAGHVEAVGRNVTHFKPGDAVFGWCGGAFAEYARTSQSKLVMKPDNASFEQAAAVPVAALTALQGLRDKGKIQPGRKVLINGASGGVGTFAVQIAKSFGADVTGVCSTRNVAMVRSIGADRVIDYTKEDFTQSAQPYDLIFDNVSNHSFSERRRILTSNGICVLAGIGGAGSHEGQWARLGGSLKALVASWFISQKFVTFIARITREDLTILSDLMESGKVTPVIDKRYRLNEVAQALRYLEEGHAQGKVVITVEHDNYA